MSIKYILFCLLVLTTLGCTTAKKAPYVEPIISELSTPDNRSENTSVISPHTHLKL